ncbi:hypothetical protein, partial [Lactobacillus xujianguonis]|uniref:hypothetical protein n=1 Tax=Lactobacillus xujianguonis TaxID=2495899 RepID=UPI000FFAC3F5
WSKDQSSLCKNKKDRKRRSTNSKSRVGLIVFWYLRVSFFPDTLNYSNLTSAAALQDTDPD